MNTPISSPNILQQMKEWVQSENVGRPDPELCNLIAEDPTSRGALLVLASELFGVGPASESLDCEDCNEDIPAYIETVHTLGIRAAVQRYPDVWWHLWTCSACAEVYRLTDEIVTDEEQGVFRFGAALEQIGATSSSDPTQDSPGSVLFQWGTQICSLTRTFLNYALSPLVQPRLSVCRSVGDEEESIIFDDETTNADYQLQLSVTPRQEEHWLIKVTLTPPPVGNVVLRFDHMVFRAPLERGRADVQIPQSLLTDTGGPPLSIGLEPPDQ
jgi:hypothetical protein